MNKRKFFILFCFLLVFFQAETAVFADTSTTVTIQPYTKDEFPQWAQDLRRTEIITFGSLPFVTIWVTVAYSALVNGEFHNPLDKSGSSFSTSDQVRIMQIAALSSISLGLTDLIINLTQRAIYGAHSRRTEKPETITVTPFTNEVPPPLEKGNTIQEDKNTEPSIPNDYLKGGLQSAIF